MLIKIYSFGFGILIIIMVASLTEKGMREEVKGEENPNDPR